jgi:hypothetical protein
MNRVEALGVRGTLFKGLSKLKMGSRRNEQMLSRLRYGLLVSIAVVALFLTVEYGSNYGRPQS